MPVLSGPRGTDRARHVRPPEGGAPALTGASTGGGSQQPCGEAGPRPPPLRTGGRRVPSRRDALSSVPRFEPPPARKVPALRANPFPEVTNPMCRLPLPTLFQSLEAANPGDLMRMWVRPGAKFTTSPRAFQGPAGARPDAARAAALYGNLCPFLGLGPLQGTRNPYKEKRTLPGAPVDVTRFVCVTARAPAATLFWRSARPPLSPAPATIIQRRV